MPQTNPAALNVEPQRSQPPRIFTPHALLRDSVQCFWLAERQFDGSDPGFVITPDSTLELLFTVGAPCTLQSDSGRITLSACYLVGLLDSPLRLQSHGFVRTLGARLAPWAGALVLRGALGVAPSAQGVIDGILPLDSMPILALLSDRPAEAVRALEMVLLERVVERSIGEPVVAQATARIIAEHGNLNIEALAQASAVSGRTLRRRFDALLGVGPKRLAELTRFQHVRDALWERPDVDLATLAASAGYADQAHMQRTFRRLSGSTPRQFASEMRALRARFGLEPGRNLQSFTPPILYSS